MNTIRRSAIALALTGVAVLGLAGCASSSDSSDSSEQSQIIGPVIADLNTIDGTTVNVAKGRMVDLTGDDETFADWTAEIADPSIVSFTAGKVDGDAEFNPGLTAEKVGSTEVTMTNSVSGESVTFTVKVTE